jgi:hypothetical protein
MALGGLNLFLSPGPGGRGPLDSFWIALCVSTVGYYFFGRRYLREPVKPAAPRADPPEDSS